MIRKVILITGCSSGIGLNAAIQLNEQGYQVIASCRKAEDVARLRALNLQAVQLDVSNMESIRAAFAEVMILTSGRLDVLINNAGYGQVGALEDVSTEVLSQQFATNVFGLHELCRLAIPVMRKQGSGRIINISSILGLVSLAFRGAYCASKYAVEGLTDTLRLELASSGIKVIAIEPGPIESNFRDRCVDVSLQLIDRTESFFSKQYAVMLARYQSRANDSVFTLKPQAVIDKIIHAIEAKRPKPKYVITFPAHFMVFLKRILSNRLLHRFLLLASRQDLA